MRSALFYPIVLLLLLACGPAPENAVPVAPSPTSFTVPVLDTAAAYRTAIAEYIKVFRKSDASFPDTVYIGRHAEFPGIELPDTIGNTFIRIVTPAEGEALKEGEHFAYLNIFGWFATGQAEFYVVNFTHGMRHWPDGRDDRHLRFAIGSGPTELVLDTLWQ